MTYGSSFDQEIRLKLVEALGDACKSPSDYVATEALKDLREIKSQVFNQEQQ